MANHERRLYEPSDEVRVFDGSEEDEDIESSRLPLLIVLALLVLAMFAGVVWLAYTQGVARGRSEAPVLAAASGPERVAPAQPGGANIPYQGFKIYEQPAPADESADNATSPGGSVALSRSLPARQTTVLKKEAPRPLASNSPAKKPVAESQQPSKAANAKPKSLAALIQQAQNQNQPPQPKAPAKAQAPATPVRANGAPRQLLASNAPASATSSQAVAHPQAAKSGSDIEVFLLQIGAYKSQDEANAAWQAYKAKHAALLSGYRPDIKEADLGEKGIWYRLRVGGLKDRLQAVDLCERLKADGGSCFLSK